MKLKFVGKGMKMKKYLLHVRQPKPRKWPPHSLPHMQGMALNLYGYMFNLELIWDRDDLRGVGQLTLESLN